jgi:hypothetical protein
MKKFIICLIFGCLSLPALAQKRSNFLVQAKKTVKQDELRIFPGIQIPLRPEKYTWKTTLKYNGEDFKYTNIRVFSFKGGKRTKVGEIPPGTEVIFNSFKKGGHNFYYSIPFVHSKEGFDPKNQIAWIQGAHIEPTGKK